MKAFKPTIHLLAGLLLLTPFTQGAPGYRLSSLENDRPIVMGNVNAPYKKGCLLTIKDTNVTILPPEPSS